MRRMVIVRYVELNGKRLGPYDHLSKEDIEEHLSTLGVKKFKVIEVEEEHSP